MDGAWNQRTADKEEERREDDTYILVEYVTIDLIHKKSGVNLTSGYSIYGRCTRRGRGKKI